MLSSNAQPPRPRMSGNSCLNNAHFPTHYSNHPAHPALKFSLDEPPVVLSGCLYWEVTVTVTTHWKAIDVRLME